MYYFISIIITIIAFVLGYTVGYHLGEAMEVLRRYDEEATK